MSHELYQSAQGSKRDTQDDDDSVGSDATASLGMVSCCCCNAGETLVRTGTRGSRPSTGPPLNPPCSVSSNSLTVRMGMALDKQEQRSLLEEMHVPKSLMV